MIIFTYIINNTHMALYSKEIIEIKDYRKKVNGKCLSTSHDYPIKKYKIIALELLKAFKTFDVSVSNKIAIITIPF